MMAFSLTDEQERVVRIAESGHNLLLTGKAGTGKSFVIDTIVRRLKARRRKVVVVCSSGISCTVYDESTRASTVHSHYALYTADLPGKMVVERAISMEHTVQRIKSADTVIWDECGMSSQRTLELVNRVHHLVASECDYMKPFGGKQFILVGDFLQLKPVPNIFDSGRFMFESDVFVAAIPHRFELTRAIRQDLASARFVNALEEIRMGRCTEVTETYLKSLSRPIQGDLVHIYFRKLAVELHNQNVLQSMPGTLITINCIDEKDTEGISCPAPQKLLLKAGARVMLVWNLSHDLKNGSSGIFLREVDNQLEVEISRRVIRLNQVTWLKHNRKGEVVGSRTQYPLTLFYASTCHKVQGLTLDGAVVHSCKEFVPGLIYVAASRVKHEDQLQLVNFNRKQLIPPSTEVLAASTSDDERAVERNRLCCNQQELEEKYFEVCDKGEEHCEDRGAPESLEVDANPDGLVLSFFEHEDDDIVVDLAQLYGTLEQHEEDLSHLPDNINVYQLVQEGIVPSPKSEFARNKNVIIQDSMNSPQFKERLLFFAKIQWYNIFLIFRKYILGNDIEEHFQMKRKDFNEAANKLYVDIICSAVFKQQLQAVFDVESLLPTQRSIGSTLTNTLYRLFVHQLADTFVQQQQTECVALNMSEMPVEGLAKIRHVGGWAVRKELERCRRYVRTNMFSNHASTIKRVKDCHRQSELLEEHVIEPYELLIQCTDFSGTLDVTEDRQYRERGLLHISDKCFLFFRRLEELRINLMNVARLQQTVHKEGFVDATIAAVKNDDELALLWDDMFMDVSEECNQDLIIDLNNGIITRYMRMGSCQFLKDFRRAFNLKKSSEHRKKILQKQQVASVKRDHVPYDEIVKDRSRGKRTSHSRLFVFVNQHKADGVQKVYQKKMLVTLCKAYGITTRAKDNKKKLSMALAHKVTSQREAVIPHPWHFLQPLSSETTSNGESVVLRIRLSRSE